MGWQESFTFKTICRLVLISFYFQTVNPASFGYGPNGFRWPVGFNEAVADTTPATPPSSSTPSTTTTVSKAAPVLPLQLAPDDYLGSTVEANTSDPYITQKATELNHDPALIFAFVRDQIGNEVYKGSLRGARGTLWSKAGNALDKASLMIALLRASNIPARYAAGTLPDDKAKQIINSMFKMPLNVVGCPDENAPRAEPDKDAVLLTEAREHHWVEFNEGGGFQAADPSFSDLELGTPAIEAVEHFNQVPDTLRHKVTVRLKREIYLALLGLTGNGQDMKTVLEHTFTTAELVGKPVSAAHFVNSSGNFWGQTHTYSPYLLVGQGDADISDDEVIRGEDYQELISLFPLGSQYLSGVFLEYEVFDAKGNAQLYEKTIADRIGYAVRQNGGTTTVTMPENGVPLISEVNVVTANILPGLQNSNPLIFQNQRLKRLIEQYDLLKPQLDQVPSSEAENTKKAAIQKSKVISTHIAVVTLENIGIIDSKVSDDSLMQLEKGYLVKSYYVSPRITIGQSYQNDDKLVFGIDLLKNDIRTSEYFSQVKNVKYFFENMRGILESSLEARVLEFVTGQSGNGTIWDYFDKLANFENFTLITKENINELKGLPISQASKSLISHNVLLGHIALVPAVLSGSGKFENFSWLEIDSLTGHTISVREDGSHGALIEYIGFMDNPVNQALLTYIGALVGMASKEFENIAIILGSGISSINIQKKTKADLLLNIEGSLGGTLGGLGGFLPGKSSELFICMAGGGGKSIISAAQCALGLFPTMGAVNAAFSGFSLGYQYGFRYLERNQAVDPVVYPFLSSDLAAPPVPNSPSNKASVLTNLVLDNLFTYPAGSDETVQIPSVFKAEIQNTGPATDTFKLAFSNVPAGYKAQSSLSEVTIPAGHTAEVGVCIKPESPSVPPTGTTVPFKLDVTSTSNPGVKSTGQAQVEIPDLHAVMLQASPGVATLVPGSNSPVKLIIQDTGNVAETVQFSVSSSSGLNVSAPTSVNLVPGESVTQTLTLAVDSNVALNSTLTATVTASFGPTGATQTQVLKIPISVAVQGVKEASAAAQAATQLGNADLTTTLDGLSTQLNGLVSAPGNAFRKEQTLASLDSLIKQIGQFGVFNPGLIATLTAARGALVQSETSSSVLDAINGLGAALETLNGFVERLVRQDVSAALTPASQSAWPQMTLNYTVSLVNKGSEATRYRMQFIDLPSGVNARLSEEIVSLAPGENKLVNAKLTQTSANRVQSFNFGVTATALDSVTGEMTDVARAAYGEVRARREALSVVSVGTDPGFADPGARLPVSARVLNAINQEKSVLVGYRLLDSSGQVLFNSPAVDLHLSKLDALTDVDLGTLDTTGFATGEYTIEASISEANGTPIPNAIGRGKLWLGSPVAAKLEVTPDVLAPGYRTVTNRLTIDASNALPAPLGLMGQTAVPGAKSVVVKDHYAYVCGVNGVRVVDVSDPANPVPGQNFGPSSAFACALTGQGLLVLPLSGTKHDAYLYDISDPANPKFIASRGQVYNTAVISGLSVVNDKVFASSNLFWYYPGNNQIIEQNGDLESIDISNPAVPARLQSLYGGNNGHSSAAGGEHSYWQALAVDQQTLLIGSTTSTGGATQTGEARVKVIDISNPSAMTPVLDNAGQPVELAIPGMMHAVGLARQGDKLLVTGSSGGWGSLTADLNLTGNTVVALVDISSPRAPKLISTKVLTRSARGIGNSALTGNSIITHIGGLEALAPGLFLAKSLGGVNDHPVFLLIDISDTTNIRVSEFTAPSELMGFSVVGDKVYAASQSGLLIYQRDTVGLTLSVSAFLAKDAVITDIGSFSDPAVALTDLGNDNQLDWRPTLSDGRNSLTLSWQSRLDALQPGEIRPVVKGGHVDFSYQGNNRRFDLPRTQVSVGKVLSLFPDFAGVAPGGVARFQVNLSNPTDGLLNYTLSTQGLRDGAARFDSPTVSLAAHQSVNVELQIQTRSDEKGESHFSVLATEANGSQTNALAAMIIDGEPIVQSNLAQGVMLSLSPETQKVGQGAFALSTLRVFNTGNQTETLAISILPDDDNLFIYPSVGEVVVTPGENSYVDVPINIYALAGVGPGNHAVQISVSESSSRKVLRTLTGQVIVQNQGMETYFDQFVYQAGDEAFLRVLNLGAEEDVFDIRLAGPVAVSTILDLDSVSLLPGDFFDIPVTLTSLDWSLPGYPSLFASVTSRSNSAVTAYAQAWVEVAEHKGATATLSPAIRTLANPGSANFSIDVVNIGNIEDSYSAEIVNNSTHLTASLNSLDGSPTQQIPVFRLPGLATGKLTLTVSSQQRGTGVVNVAISSNSDPSIRKVVTATLFVAESVNLAPVANAGTDKNVATAEVVTLDGTASSDPDGNLLSEYRWHFVSVPDGSALQDSDLLHNGTPNAQFTPDVAGLYRVELFVSDGQLDSEPDTVDIVAANSNVPPNANAGLDQTVEINAQTLLDGSQSIDPDGGPGSLQYAWRLNDASQSTHVTLLNANQAKATLSADAIGDYGFTLRVFDGNDAAEDSTIVHVTRTNLPPVADAGLDVAIELGKVAQLNASGSRDSDTWPQPIAYAWHLVSIPAGSHLTDAAIQIDPADLAKVSFTPDVLGDYVLQLSVLDGQDSATDNVLVKVLPALRYQEVSDLIPVTSSALKSTLNRVTRKMTSSATLTLRNASSLDVKAPIRLMFDLGGASVAVVGAKVDEAGRTYLEVPNQLLKPGDAIAVDVQFVYASTVKFTYATKVFGGVAR